MLKTFEFSDEDNALTVKVSEKMDPSYGLYTWPSSIVLAQYLWHNRQFLNNKNILELGTGTGLPSLVAIMCGNAKSVTLSDDQRQPKCFQNMTESCSFNDVLTYESEINGLFCRQNTYNGTSVTVVGITWGEVPPIFLDHTSNGVPFPDIILGSDCLFDESVFDPVLFTARHLLTRGSVQKADPSRFLCTYQVRSSKISVSYHMSQWGLVYKEIPIETFSQDKYNIANSGMPGNHKVKMLEVTLSDNIAR